MVEFRVHGSLVIGPCSFCVLAFVGVRVGVCVGGVSFLFLIQFSFCCSWFCPCCCCLAVSVVIVVVFVVVVVVAVIVAMVVMAVVVVVLVVVVVVVVVVVAAGDVTV